MRGSSTFRTVLTALFAALVCVATMFIRVPSPVSGYINLGDGFVLLDYKTDRVEGDPALWAERHRRQVELYARALTTLTGRPVVEKYVVFLNGRACVRL